MKTLLIIMVLAITSFAQSDDLPIMGDISEIQGQLKYYLHTDAFAAKQIESRLSGFERASDPKAAEFIIEFRRISEEQKIGLFYAYNAEMVVYFIRDGRKVIVWQDSSYGDLPMRTLAKRFAKAMSKK